MFSRFPGARRRAHAIGTCAIVLGGFGLLDLAPVQAQSHNVTLLSNRDAYDFHSGVWGYSAPNGVELAIIGTDLGVSFVDVTNPSAPNEVAYFPHPSTIWTEIRTYGRYAYWSNDDQADGLGIVDLSNPLSPVFVGFHTAFTTCHSLHIDTQRGWLYCNGCPGNQTFILDVGANPTNPPTVAVFSDYYVHDSYSRDGISYFAAIFDGALGIEDFTNPPTFTGQSFTQYPGGATHNCWLTDDSNYLLTTDETTGGHLKIWDVQDLTAPQQISEYAIPGDGSIIHNVYVKGNLAIASWYTAGLQILDITDVFNPQRVGYYDTYPGTAGYTGAWGVYPYAQSGNIYISDMETGLYVFSFQPNYGLVRGTVTDATTGDPLPGVVVEELLESRTATTDALGRFTLALEPGSHTVDLSLFAYADESVSATVTAGQTTNVTVALDRLPAGTISGFVRSSLGGSGLAGATLTVLGTPLGTTSGVGGAFSVANVPEGPYTVDVSLVGFGSRQGGIHVVANRTVTRDFVLNPSLIADNAETDQGWTLGVAGDGASTGIWIRDDPVGTGGGSVQPEDDHTPAPGTKCFVTGNCTPGCSTSENDVDNGRTTLLSPVYNLTGQNGAILQYYRWYCNAVNGNGSDTWRVEVSSNGGTNWTTVEQFTTNKPFWERVQIPLQSFITLTNNVRVRFLAQDLGASSLVEAAIDDVEILIPQAPSDVPIELPAATTLALTIEPNPVRFSTALRLALPTRQPVQLSIVDVQGRVVRRLQTGLLDAGRHDFSWDGRDQAGRNLAQGLYFARVSTPSGRLSEKVILIK
ncbi:MAG: choice-of-anchor B family protein [Candidatus Eisenbacteria bacterium]|nr:choice-of-anchor B family protein [Candidatus Eisenbacteria bacterium]